MSADIHKKPDRPVWSHKTEEGFLERFLKGEIAEDALAPSRDETRGGDASDGAPDHAPEPRSPAAEAPADAQRDRGAEGEPSETPELKDRVIAALRQIYDPEIPVNLYDLGLIYDIDVSKEGDVEVTMTLTTPHCPVAESMPYEVETRILAIEGVRDVRVHLVWDPPWDISRMSDEARLELGLL